MPPAAMQQRATAASGPSKPPQVSVTDSSLSKLGASSTVSGRAGATLKPSASSPSCLRRADDPRPPAAHPFLLAQLFKIEVLLPQQPNAQDVRGCARARAYARNPRGAR